MLPLGLLAGLLMPWAAQPLRTAIPGCIGVLLFLAVLRLYSGGASIAESVSVGQWVGTLRLVVVSQVLLPLLVYGLGTLVGVPVMWVLAATLVAAAPAISGSPSLVLLLRGDGASAMRWLMLGTALLPVSCLPILYLLFPAQSITIMLQPSLLLLALIGTSVVLAVVALRVAQRRTVTLQPQVLDGVSAIVLAVMVIGLMSAVHDPATRVSDVLNMLVLAIGINVGLQFVGVMLGRFMQLGKARTVAQGVVFGNRNIALFLAALPSAQMEPLLLFIACYQVPMYLTPLIGGVFYRRLE